MPTLANPPAQATHGLRVIEGMREMDLQKHNWDKVREALCDLQEYTEENEPYAVNFLAAIQEVLDSLPENE